MSESNAEQIHDVLNEAEAASSSILTEEADREAQPAILETAAQANTLLESMAPEDILAALELDTLPDGSEPESIPEAIAAGDPEQVDSLQRLLHLARLAETDQRELEGAAGAIRQSISDEQVTADEPDDTDSGAQDEATDETGGLGEQLRSALQSTVTDTEDDLEGLKRRLEDASDSVSDEAGDEDQNESGDEDDGLLDGGLGSKQDDGGGAGSASRLSTVAPSPSERADMGAVARYSTMPDKD